MEDWLLMIFTVLNGLKEIYNMQKRLLYFGCIGGPGHYLWANEINKIHSDAYVFKTTMPELNPGILKYIDGNLTPGGKFMWVNGKYQVNDIHPLTIVSWWDQSEDNRPGSNSNLIGYNYGPGNVHAMLTDAYELFPSVMNRQKLPVSAHGGLTLMQCDYCKTVLPVVSVIDVWTIEDGKNKCLNCQGKFK